MKRQDDCMDKLTLREAYQRYYHIEELATRTRDHFRSSINCWEKFSGNPPLKTVTNATLEVFRNAALELLHPRTVNGYWTAIRSILRRVGPPTEGNPWALDLFPGWRVPAMRLCRVPYKRPTRLSMEDLDKIYFATKRMRSPLIRVSSATAFWQCLLVFTYYTALRSSDIFKARWSDIDYENQTLFVKLHKTGVEADLPLHQCVLDHLDRMGRNSDSEQIFPIACETVYEKPFLQRLQEQSGIKFGLHDLRRTACSEIDAVAPGMGKVLLLHAPTNVTERSYLNALPELRGAIEKMVSPLTFRHGVKQADRAIKEAKKTMLDKAGFSSPFHPPKEAFRFSTWGVTIGEHYVPVRPKALIVLKSIVESDCSAALPRLLEVIVSRCNLHQGMTPSDALYRRAQEIRKAMKRYLPIPQNFNPLIGRKSPNIGRHPGHLERYEFVLPSGLLKNH